MLERQDGLRRFNLDARRPHYQLFGTLTTNCLGEAFTVTPREQKSSALNRLPGRPSPTICFEDLSSADHDGVFGMKGSMPLALPRGGVTPVVRSSLILIRIGRGDWN
jgi:hypothetical protein